MSIGGSHEKKKIHNIKKHGDGKSRGIVILQDFMARDLSPFLVF